MYFEKDGETLWNPSNGAGRLFLRQVEVYEAELGLPSGIGPGRYEWDPDVLEVSPAEFAEFVRALVSWHCLTRHSVILALSEGFVATAVALARRAGIEVEPAVGDGPGGGQYDVQVPGDPRATAVGVGSALDSRARELDRRMAR